LVDILPHSFSIYSGIYGKITNKWGTVSFQKHTVL
jgi:hypothetical protein